MQALRQLLDKEVPTADWDLDATTPFEILVATVLSARCSYKKVNEMTPALFAAAPTALAMSKLTYNELLEYVYSSTYNKNKAMHLSVIAQSLKNKPVPNTMRELEQLPGVGRKTAGVVMARAFGVPMFPVDTHVAHLAREFKLVPENASLLQIENTMRDLVPKSEWIHVHNQMVAYGRSH